MIDFIRLAQILEDGASLTLNVIRNGDTLTAIMLPKLKGKETKEPPITLSGTAQDLTDFFAPEIASLTELYSAVANIPKPKPAVQSSIAARKAKLKDKKDSAAAKPEKKEQPQKDEKAKGPEAAPSLFSEPEGGKAAAEETPAESPAPEKTEPAEDDDGF